MFGLVVVLAAAMIACSTAPTNQVRSATSGETGYPESSAVGGDTGTSDVVETGADDSGGGGGGDDTADADTGEGPSPLLGIDVSGWDPDIAWSAVARSGMAYAIAKATEGDYYTNDEFDSQYEGAAGAGLIRGAYHFAIPDGASGSEQADFFVAAGGGWQADGQTLPGTLDIEYNPYGSTCYDLSKSAMTQWIHDFSDEYERRTGRPPMIYTTADWWNSCVGSTAFAEENPLWVAHYGASSPTLPTGWGQYTLWQYTSTGTVDGIPGDVDISTFEGDRSALVDLADDTR